MLFLSEVSSRHPATDPELLGGVEKPLTHTGTGDQDIWSLNKFSEVLEEIRQ